MRPFKVLALSSILIFLSACNGSSEKNSKNSISQNSPPNALIQEIVGDFYQNETVQLDGASSYDPDNDSLTYHWEILEQPEGSQAMISSNTESNPLFTAKIPGIYTLQLIVNDGKVDSEPLNLKLEILDEESRLICNVNPPSFLEINTENQAQILKETYINANLILNNNGLLKNLETEIRGRGNSTWLGDKKPYRLKLKKNSITNFAGMPEGRNWAMLANYYDGSMLRNSAALCLGKNFIRNSWTSDYRFVDVKLNSRDQGLYLVTEHVEVSENKINLGDNNTTSDPLAEAFFIELTPANRVNDRDIFIESSRGSYFEVKSDVSENEKIKNLQLENIKKYIDKVEDVIYKKNFDKINGYSKYIDVDSAVDYILLNELFKDSDRFWANGHFYKPKNGKLVFGPIWDYDLSAGGYACNNTEKVEGWWIMTRGYPENLIQDPTFKKKIIERWKVLNKKIPNLIKYITFEANNIKELQEKNLKIWPLDPYSNFCGENQAIYLGNSYQAQVDYLTNWLEQRARWMNEQFTHGNF